MDWTQISVAVGGVLVGLMTLFTALTARNAAAMSRSAEATHRAVNSDREVLMKKLDELYLRIEELQYALGRAQGNDSE